MYCYILGSDRVKELFTTEDSFDVSINQTGKDSVSDRESSSKTNTSKNNQAAFVLCLKCFCRDILLCLSVLT